MRDDIAIDVNAITKSFKVYPDKGNTFKEKVIFRKRRRYEERQVLKGLSFQMKRGEAVGLIGHNGCGKSTTLKLLTKIIYPDSGNINIKGRVSSLIELGAGFHPDMSGRENIYINASIFGLNRNEINARLQDIIRFSELEEYIDNPVRTYSSGMYMRLAFSVAINVNAEVLLIDEILAVGDVNFQQKCFAKLKEIKAEGTTIVIVSHSLDQIEKICDRTIWLDDGRIKEEGIPKFVHEKYLANMEMERLERIKVEQDDINKQEEEKHEPSETVNEQAESLPDFCSINAVRKGNKKIIFTEIYLENDSGKKSVFDCTGEKISVCIEYRCNESDLKADFGVGIYREDGIYCFGMNTAMQSGYHLVLTEQGKVKLVFEKLELLAGKYFINIAMQSPDTGEIYDYIWNVLEFQILNSGMAEGVCNLKNSWYHNGEIFIGSKGIEYMNGNSAEETDNASQGIREARKVIQTHYENFENKTYEQKDELEIIRKENMRLQRSVSSMEAHMEKIARQLIKAKWKQIDMDVQTSEKADDIIRCNICDFSQRRDSYEVFESECQFGGGRLIRYKCPVCGVIFGPSKFMGMLQNEINEDYDTHYLGFNEGDSTQKELDAFFMLEPDKNGIYLNYGCGHWSESMEYLRKQGYHVYGYDPYASESDKPFIIGDKERLSHMRFEGIFSNDMLEHLIDPIEEFLFMKSLLRNNDSKMSHSTACYIYRYETTRFHTHFFEGNSINILCEKAGFEIEKHVDELKEKDFICNVYKPVEINRDYTLIALGLNEMEGRKILKPEGVMYGPYICLGKHKQLWRLILLYDEEKIPELRCRITEQAGEILLQEIELHSGENMLLIESEGLSDRQEIVIHNNSQSDIEIIKLELVE